MKELQITISGASATCKITSDMLSSNKVLSIEDLIGCLNQLGAKVNSITYQLDLEFLSPNHAFGSEEDLQIAVCEVAQLDPDDPVNLVNETPGRAGSSRQRQQHIIFPKS